MDEESKTEWTGNSQVLLEPTTLIHALTPALHKHPQPDAPSVGA
jgi:hypothetical protein